ncbi:GNAT family N-acetyltransferase [Streptomyces sp. NPDC058417]|uniref:GNAT family N-acetyltransferase n=1 Tax=unclassified Streptomyces TaxID=2593676 RepID=UPI00365ABDC1
MRVWGGDQVRAAVAESVALLRTAADRDWDGVKAGRLDWTCRETAEHIASDLLAYAGQLAGRAQHAYVPFEITFDEGTDPAGVLDVIETTGALLAATVRTTPPRVRAFHPYPFRSADREGFAAMGVAEVLLHTHDIAEGLGLAYEPSAGLCADVLARIFPHVRPGPDPWPTLLWATGRGAVTGRPPVTGWRWSNPLVLPAGRLALEGVTPAAAQDLAAGGDGGFVWLGDRPYDGTREVARALREAWYAGTHRPEFGMFAVVREDGRAVGSVSFHGVPDEEGRTEIGYDLVPAARGHGHATAAVTALTDWALSRDDVRAVCATVEEANTASAAVLTRSGFVRTPVEETGPAPERDAEGRPLRLYVRRA